MDPGGNSALLSVFGLGIERYNFVTHTLMQVSNDSGALGMAYGSAGHLFVVTAPNQVAQMDPNTGAILNGVTLPSTGGTGANGLAFDSFTGKLYVTDDLNDLTARGVYALPTNPSATLLAGTLDVLANGLTSDGNGRLYIAAANSLMSTSSPLTLYRYWPVTRESMMSHCRPSFSKPHQSRAA